MLNVLCALTSDNALFGERSSKAARHVKFNDALNTCHNITPYSEIYGCLANTKVASTYGWKCVSARACHFTSTTSDVPKARLAVTAKTRDVDKILMHDRTMIRIGMAKVHGEKTLRNISCARVH